MSLTLKTVQNDEKIDGVDMTYLTKRFKNLSKKVISQQRKRMLIDFMQTLTCVMVVANQDILSENVLMVKVILRMAKKTGKDRRKDQVLNKYKKKVVADEIMIIKALSVWGNSSGDLKKKNNLKTQLAVEDDDEIYDGLFAFMAWSDDEEDDDDEVTLLDFKDNLDLYSTRKLKKTSMCSH